MAQTHYIDEFQGTGKAFHTRDIYTPTFDSPQPIPSHIATVDVRLDILARRFAATGNKSIEQELLETIQSRNTISNHMKQIVSFAMLPEKHLPLTQHDCYKTATQYIHEKCFDIQVRIYSSIRQKKKYAYILE